MTDKTPSNTSESPQPGTVSPPMDRRAALVRLGLTAGALYAAPSLVVLKDAQAGGAGKGKGDEDPPDPGSLPG